MNKTHESDATVHTHDPPIDDYEGNLQNNLTLFEESQSSHSDGIDNALDVSVQNNSLSGENNSDVNCDEYLTENSQLESNENHNESYGTSQHHSSTEQLVHVCVDKKPSFGPVQVESNDSSAFNHLFDTAQAALNLSPSEKASFNSEGLLEITKKYDEDLECTYVYGKIPMPRQDGYKVKLDDCVTGTIPFKENVSFSIYKHIHYHSIPICFIFSPIKIEHSWYELKAPSKR